MAYPAGIMLTQFRFSLQDGGTEEDIAEFGLHWQTQTEAPPADWNAYLATLAQAAYTEWTDHAIASEYRTNVKLASVTARGYDTSLHTVAEQIYTPSTLWAGTATGTCLPWQVSFAVSLYGYAPGGFALNSRRKRGRVYLPPMVSSAIDNPANAEVSTDTATAFMGQISGLIGGVDSAMSDPLIRPVIVSRAGQMVTTAGWVRADTKFDSQRRRVRQLPASVVSSVLA